jgi:hypothetical protein
MRELLQELKVAIRRYRNEQRVFSKQISEYERVASDPLPCMKMLVSLCARQCWSETWLLRRW